MNQTTRKTTLSMLADKNLYRHRKILSGPQGAQIVISGKTMLNFSSNDYLGLANHPKVAEAMVAGIKRYGVGTGASHLISGHTEAHEHCEAAFADFFGTERALLFGSGYMANLGVVDALVDRHGLLLQDKRNHASLIDAGRMCDGKVQRYTHNDMQHLTTLLDKTSKPTLIASDSVFSMDGDVADIKTMMDLASKYQAEVLLDEAHGFGVLGQHGKGLSSSYSLAQSPWLMATFGKALGTSGAVVAGTEDQVEYLIQKARTYTYTTAMPAAIAMASTQALQLLKEAEDQRSHLKELIKELRLGLVRLGFDILDSQTPIQGILLKDEATALAMSDCLYQRGIFVQAIRPPTVETARLRLTLSADHQAQDIQKLCAVLEECQHAS